MHQGLHVWCIHNTWGCGGKFSAFVALPPHWVNYALTFRHQRYFLFPWIETLTTQLDYFESSSPDCGSGRECKKNHLRWLLSVVLEFSSCLFVWLYYGNYSTSRPVWCGFRHDSRPKCRYSGFFFWKGSLPTTLPVNCWKRNRKIPKHRIWLYE